MVAGMAYCTEDDVRTASRVSGDGQSASDTVSAMPAIQLAEIIREAQATVDAYVSSRYALPGSPPVPDALRSCTIEVALYLATLTFRRSKDIGEDDPVTRRYRHAMELLKSISAGTVRVPGLTTRDATDDASSDSDDVVSVNPYSGDLFNHAPGQIAWGYYG